MGDGRINFKFTADNSEVLKAVDQTDKSLSEMAKEAEQAGARVGVSIEKSGKSAKSAATEWTGASEDIVDSINIQKKVVSELEKQYKDTQKAIDKMAPGAAQQAMATEMRKIKKEIDAEKEALQMLSGEQAKTEKSTISMRTQMRILKEELAQLPEGTKEYAAKVRELGTIMDRYADVNKQGRIFADDNKYLRASTEAMQGFSGAIQVGAGTLALFGVNSENAQKITAKLMGVMSIANGITQVANVLNKDSYVSHLLVAKAKNIVTVATTKLSTALGISTVAAQALMATLTLGLSVAITAVVVAINKMKTTTQDASKAQEELAERNKKFAESAAAGAAKQGVAYETLRRSYVALGDDIKAKEQYIKDNEKAFNDLEVSIDSVTDADNVFIENTGAFKEAIKERAKAAAAMELASDAYKKALEKMIESDRLAAIQREEEEKKRQVQSSGEYYQDVGYRVATGMKEMMDKEADTQMSLFDSYFDFSLRMIESAKEKAKAAGFKAFPGWGKTLTGTEEGKSQLRKEQDFERERLSVIQTANKEELALYRSTIKDKEELRKFDLQQTLAAIEEQERRYKRLAELAGEKAPDTSIFEKRKETAIQSSEVARKQIEEDAVKKQEEENKKLLEQYATYAEKYLAKTKELKDKEGAILAAGGTGANVDVLRAQIEEQQKSLDEQFYKNTEGFEAFSSEIINLTTTQISELLSTIEADLAASTEGIASESQAAMRVQISVLKEQLAAKKAKEPTDKEKELQQWQETQKVLSGIIQTSNQVIDSFDGISESTKKALKTVISVSTNVISAINSIKTFSVSASKAMTGSAEVAKSTVSTVEKASVILTVITAALQIATAIADLFVSSAKKRREEMEKLKNEINAQEAAYNKILQERALLFEKGVTIFGVDEYGKAINAVKEGFEAIAKLQDKLTQGGDTPKGIEMIFGRQVDLRTEMEKMYAGLANIEVKTGSKKSGFLGLGKRKDVMSGILDVYPELIDANGKFNATLAQSILDYRTMSEESKIALSGMIDQANQVEAAFKQVEDYLSSIFGELGSKMTQGIVESFKAGKSAATTFVDDIGSLLEQMSNQMLYSIMLQPLFETADKQMKEIMENTDMNPQDQFKQMSKVMGQLSKDATAKQSEMAALLEQFRKDAAAEGISIYEDTRKQAEAQGKGFQALSQETGTRLEGVMTSTSISTANTADNTRISSEVLTRAEPVILDIRDTMDILSLNTRKIYDEVILIRQNTAFLPGMDRKLSQVVTNTAK